VDIANGIELTEVGASPYILRNLSEHTTLAFTASFDVSQTHKQSVESLLRPLRHQIQ